MQHNFDPQTPATPEVSRRFLAGVGLLVAAIGFSAHSFVASTASAAPSSANGLEVTPAAELQATEAGSPCCLPRADDIVRPSADRLRKLGVDLCTGSTAPA